MNKGIYKDKNGLWFIKTKKRGKNITIRGYQSKKEADDDYDFAIQKWFQNHHLSPNKNVALFGDVANDYIEYTRNGKASRTADRERTQINTYWSVVFANDTINNIYKFDRLKIIYSNLKDNNNLNTRKKHDLVFTFLAFTNYCYIQKLIGKDALEEATIIFQPIKYTKRTENARRIAKESEIKALLNVIPHNTKNYFMFLVLISCGLRISELLGLCNDCFVDNKVEIKRQRLTNGKLSNKLKTSQSYRQVPLSKELQSLVHKYIKDTNSNKIVFDCSQTNFKRLLYKYEQMAGIPQYVPHEYRHTRCFELAKKCENMSDVVYCAKIMGHSPSIFIDTYCAHLNADLEHKFFNC